MGGTSSTQRLQTYTVSYAPTGRAKCKKCKKAIAQGDLRLSRVVPNTWTGDKGESTFHYHFAHGLEAVQSVRCLTPDGDIVPPPQLELSSDLKRADAASAQRKFDAVAIKWRFGCH